MAASNLLEYLRDYLVAQGAVRKPTVPTTPTNRVPMFLDPRDGALGPGDPPDVENHPDVIVSAFVTGEVPPSFYEHDFRTRMVDLWIVARQAPLAYPVDRTIRALLVEKRNWDMAGLNVLESRQWRALQRIGSDEGGYRYTVAYSFETYATDP